MGPKKKKRMGKGKGVNFPGKRLSKIQSTDEFRRLSPRDKHERSQSHRLRKSGGEKVPLRAPRETSSLCDLRKSAPSKFAYAKKNLAARISKDAPVAVMKKYD